MAAQADLESLFVARLSAAFGLAPATITPALATGDAYKTISKLLGARVRSVVCYEGHEGVG
jgi:hypothetical protein